VWRRFGDLGFAALVAVVVTAEAIPLVWLIWVVLGSLGHPQHLAWVLAGGVATAALGLAVITAYLLAYQSVSDHRAALVTEARARWVARWLAVVSGSESAPPAPIGRDAVEALLELREALRGSEADRLLELLRRYGVGSALQDRAHGRRVTRRLHALEDLARARAPEALPTLLGAIIDPDRRIQVAAARAAARTIAAVPEPSRRDELAGTLVAALEAARLPYGVLEEVLLLADEAAPALVAAVLAREGASPAFRRAALDTVARLGLLSFASEVARHLRDPDAEVRAAALRAVARTAVLPPGARDAVREALGDPEAFVRIHAAAAARLLPRKEALERLWDRLGDPSWWVRRAAAESLAELGRAGLGTLGPAAGSHPDRYARDMAAQTLRDRVEDVVEAVAG